MRPKHKAIKGLLLTIILVGDAVALLLMLGVVSSFVAAMAVLLYESPFIPDWQVRLGKVWLPDSATVLMLSLAWLILATVLGSRLCKGEVRSKRKRTHLSRYAGASTPYSTPCKVCHYWHGSDHEAQRFLEHPCALHPTGKPDLICVDWRHGTHH